MIPYQYALRRRLMQQEDSQCTLSISGTFAAVNSYVLVDGTQYTANTTLTLNKGTEVTISLRAGASATFTLNGQTVTGTSSDSVHKYTFILTANASIVVTNSNTWYGSAEITMPV